MGTHPYCAQYTQLKVMESIAAQNVKIIPDVLIGNGEEEMALSMVCWVCRYYNSWERKWIMVMVPTGIRKNKLYIQNAISLAHVKRGLILFGRSYPLDK